MCLRLFGAVERLLYVRVTWLRRKELEMKMEDDYWDATRQMEDRGMQVVALSNECIRIL